MKFETEAIEDKQSALIISKKNYHLVSLLKQELKKYELEVFLSPSLPKNIDRFDYFYLINEQESLKKIRYLKRKKIIAIFLNQLSVQEQTVQDKNIKIINILGDKLTKEHIDKILWFSLSKTGESHLRLEIPKNKNVPGQKIYRKFPNFLSRLSKKNILAIVIVFFLFFHLIFTIPLLFSSFLFYRAAISAKKEDFPQTEMLLDISEPSFFIAKKLYSVVRPSFLIFSLALPIDSFFAVNEKSDSALRITLSLTQNSQNILKLLLKKDKSSDEKSDLRFRLKKLSADVNNLGDALNLIKQKIPANLAIKKDLEVAVDLISRLKNLIPHLENLLAYGGQKQYLLLFANNKELRPGGGFIGSFGVMTMKDLTLEEIKIYDVYDADGQLIAHVDPPDAIRKYLSQPNWFLRDSAFSPDFLENYVQAKFFLEKEMGMKDFSGAVLLTTTAIENILETFGDINLPDFNETVNKKNFYLKAQIYAEKDFFPGSIKKKNFLFSLTRQILINLDSASPGKLALGLKKSLDEKQLVLYFDDKKIQSFLDSSYWSGRLIQPKCLPGLNDCISDYFFPMDANLGVNKANFFVDRSVDLEINIDKNGLVNHTASIQFRNDSSAETFPGGTYKNYYQVLLAVDSTIKEITLDGTAVEQFDEFNEEYKKVGFYFEVKPKSIAEIKIKYRLNKPVINRNGYYQLIVQKQIGSANSDFALRISLPANIHNLKQNFPALVKDNQIIYNTSLSADKIFFMELAKE